LVHPLAEPIEPVRGDSLRPAGLHDQDVIAAGRDSLETLGPGLTQLALDPVPGDRVAGGTRHRQAEPWLTRPAVALEPVEDQEARRGRAAVSVDGVEVSRARQTVPALHRVLTRKGSYGP